MVIDYVLLEEKKREGIRRMEITENIDLDHHLLIIWLKEKRERADRRQEGRDIGLRKEGKD